MADEAWRFSLASAGLCCQFVPGQAAFEGEDDKSLVCHHSWN